MQPTNIEGIAKDVAAAVMGNPIIQITFSPGAEQDGFQSDLRIELTRVLASNPSLVRSVPSPLLPLPDQVLEAIVLAIFEAMGGEGDSSEYKHHWLNAFTSDERHGVEDTFNRCNSKGWLHTTTNTDIDASTTTLTPAGRAYLAEIRSIPQKDQPHVLSPEQMPAPDILVGYHGGQIMPAMFHFALEGDDLPRIAREHDFEVSFAALLGELPTEDENEALEAAYEKDSSKVLADWQPQVPDGWRFGGKWHDEDGPIACFLRKREPAQ